MSFDVWRKAKLRDIEVTLIDCDHKTPVSVEEGYPYIAIPQLKNGHIQLEGVRKISHADWLTWTRKLKPQVHDVIVVRRCNSGQSAVVPKNLKCAIGQNLVVLRSSGTFVFPEFLRWLVQGDDWWEQVRTYLNVGAIFDSLKCKDIPNFELTIPPLEAQKEIALILDALDNRISLLRETNITLEAIAQTLFKSWFVDFEPVKAKAEGRLPEGMDEATAALFPSEFEESVLGFIPKGWKVEKLGDIVQRITKGTTPTTFKKPFVSSGINFIKAESMTEDGDFIPDKFAFIDSDTHELLRRSQLQSGDVLITIAGTIGRMAIITEEFLPANTNQAVAIIRPISEHLPSGLLSLFLQTSALREVMDGKIVQAVQANLSLTSLSDLQLVIPPKQTVFMLYQVGIAHIDDVKKHNRSTIRTLTTLRDTLLPRLISGQLRLNQAQEIMDEVGHKK